MSAEACEMRTSSILILLIFLISDSGFANERLADQVSRGAAAMKAGNYAQALKIYEESIVQYPEASLLWAEKGRCLYSLSKPREAITAFDKAITLGVMEAWDKDVPLDEYYYQRALCAVQIKNYAQARNDLDAALKLNRKPEYHLARAMLGVGTGQDPQAIEDFSQYLRANPNNAVVFTLRAAAFERTGEFEQAVSDYQAAIELYRKQGQEKAIPSVQQALAKLKQKQPVSPNSGGSEPELPSLKQVARFRELLSADRQNRIAHGISEDPRFTALSAESDAALQKFLAKKYLELFGPNTDVRLTPAERASAENYSELLRSQILSKIANSQAWNIEDMLLQTATLEQLHRYKRRLLQDL